MKLILIDDHKVFIQGMELLLSRSNEFEVIGSFTDGLEMMRFLANGNIPDIVLLDIEMEPISGTELAKIIHQQYPNLKILMLSTYFNASFVQELLESGVAGYLLKNTGFNELKSAIKKIVEGGFAFSPEVMELIINVFKNTPSEKFSKQNEFGQLTDREIELIKLIGEEMTMKEIAERLFISEHTVKTHRKNIMAKMDVKNTAGLIKKAFILGFIE